MRRQIGSITELGKNHYKVVITTGVDPQTGKQKRRTKTVRGSRRKAEATLQLMAAKYTDAMEATITVQEFAELEYLPTLKERVAKGEIKQRTYESYKERLELHVYPYIGSVQFCDLKPSHVRICQDAAKTDAMKAEARKVMSAMFKEAVYQEIIPFNPVLSVRPPSPSTYEPDVLDEEDIEVYLWHFRDTRIEPVVLLAIGGAFRRGEITALNVDDIDFDTGLVNIDDAYVESKELGVVNDSPKNGKARRIALPRFILDRLQEILPPSGPVIQSLDGQRLQPKSISQLYERIRDKLPEGVPRISLKNLRHTSLTMAYDAIGDYERVAAHGGHSKAVSKRHYIRAHENQELKLANQVDEYMRRQIGAKRCYEDEIEEDSA